MNITIKKYRLYEYKGVTRVNIEKCYATKCFGNKD